MNTNPGNRLLGMVGTTIGGGMIGGGVQRTYLLGNQVSSALSKLTGKGAFNFDTATWVLLLGGLAVLAIGVFFTLKRR